jgi:hypothetical protein
VKAIMTDDEIPEELRPARPDVEGKTPGYMPRLPWKWIGAIGAFLVLSIGTCQLRDKQEVAALKSSVLAAHRSQLGPIVTRYQDVLAKVYRNTRGAAQRRVETFVDARLKFDALGKSPGIYLRLRAKDATTPEQIANAGLDMQPDAIPRCLGLNTVWFPELYAHGTFLEQRFIQQAEDAESVMKLRVVAEELRQRTLRDLPFVGEALKAQWFLLVLERGDNRRDAPVDAYLWDLRSDALLFSARAQADGVLVSARIAVTGTTPGQYASGQQSGAAQDCSIAAKLRGLAGAGDTAQFGSEPPRPTAALAPADAAVTSAAAPAAGDAAPPAAPSKR